MENDNDYGAGESQGFDGSTDLGNTTSPAGAQTVSPNSQGTSATDNREQELARYRNEVKRLNRALAEQSRKGSVGKNQDSQEDVDWQSPQSQYSIALEIGENRLRAKLEDIFSLYPEIPQKEISRIRANPWAFAKRDSYRNADFESAATDIEYVLADMAEEIASANPAPVKPTPASVNPNQAQLGDQEEATPGEENDENPWTMPMDKLKEKANREIKRRSQGT